MCIGVATSLSVELVSLSLGHSKSKTYPLIDAERKGVSGLTVNIVSFRQH